MKGISLPILQLNALDDPENPVVWKALGPIRNLYQGYKKAFGEEPPLISGVAIMTDTDNTGESATAYYGDILFKKSGSLQK